MRHSRDIDDLRADVAENCRTMIALAEREGLCVLVTETVRDGAYQKMLAEKGYAAAGAVTPSLRQPDPFPAASGKRASSSQAIRIYYHQSPIRRAS